MRDFRTEAEEVLHNINRCFGDSGMAVRLIETAIKKAVEAERKACTKIARKVKENYKHKPESAGDTVLKCDPA